MICALISASKRRNLHRSDMNLNDSPISTTNIIVMFNIQYGLVLVDLCSIHALYMSLCSGILCLNRKYIINKSWRLTLRRHISPHHQYVPLKPLRRRHPIHETMKMIILFRNCFDLEKLKLLLNTGKKH